MKRNARNHIIFAMAVYICIAAMKQGRFTREVDITDLAQTFDATYEEQEKAHRKAREILGDFL